MIVAFIENLKSLKMFKASDIISGIEYHVGKTLVTSRDSEKSEHPQAERRGHKISYIV